MDLQACVIELNKTRFFLSQKNAAVYLNNLCKHPYWFCVREGMKIKIHKF